MAPKTGEGSSASSTTLAGETVPYPGHREHLLLASWQQPTLRFISRAISWTVRPPHRWHEHEHGGSATLRLNMAGVLREFRDRPPPHPLAGIDRTIHCGNSRDRVRRRQSSKWPRPGPADWRRRRGSHVLLRHSCGAHQPGELRERRQQPTCDYPKPGPGPQAWQRLFTAATGPRSRPSARRVLTPSVLPLGCGQLSAALAAPRSVHPRP